MRFPDAICSREESHKYHIIKLKYPHETVTFTFWHFADTLSQSDLQVQHHCRKSSTSSITEFDSPNEDYQGQIHSILQVA